MRRPFKDANCRVQPLVCWGERWNGHTGEGGTEGRGREEIVISGCKEAEKGRGRRGGIMRLNSAFQGLDWRRGLGRLGGRAEKERKGGEKLLVLRDKWVGERGGG